MTQLPLNDLHDDYSVIIIHNEIFFKYKELIFDLFKMIGEVNNDVDDIMFQHGKNYGKLLFDEKINKLETYKSDQSINDPDNQLFVNKRKLENEIESNKTINDPNNQLFVSIERK
jgi:hypothetical protein